jgi:methionyl-tRNA formyltransferase
MRVAFAGTPAFAHQALAAIIDAGFEVPLVLTQPDRPAGRGQKLQESPVKRLALAHGLATYQPQRLKDPASHIPISEANLDLLIVAAYGLILPQAVLDLPRQGCINIHASLLPRWRGAAPIQRAIEAGDSATGITLMRMDAGLDTGAMLQRQALAIEPTDNAASLHDKLARLGAQMIVDCLRRAPDLATTAQPVDGVTYANKIDKQEGIADFRLSAEALARRIRAFDPFPGAAATFAGATIKLWRAVPEAGVGAPGTVLAADGRGIVIACGAGALRVTELQKPGSKRLPAADFLRGSAVVVGQRFDGAP